MSVSETLPVVSFIADFAKSGTTDIAKRLNKIVFIFVAIFGTNIIQSS